MANITTALDARCFRTENAELLSFGRVFAVLQRATAAAQP